MNYFQDQDQILDNRRESEYDRWNNRDDELTDEERERLEDERGDAEYEDIKDGIYDNYKWR